MHRIDMMKSLCIHLFKFFEEYWSKRIIHTHGTLYMNETSNCCIHLAEQTHSFIRLSSSTLSFCFIRTLMTCLILFACFDDFDQLEHLKRVGVC